MKGKKYLDTYIASTVVQVTPEPANDSYSYLTSFFGGNKRSSLPASVNTKKLLSDTVSSGHMSLPVSANNSPTPMDNKGDKVEKEKEVEKKKPYGELLFVQDRNYLLLVKPEKSDSRSKCKFIAISNHSGYRYIGNNVRFQSFCICTFAIY